ncbi:MAG: 50S ribosomal protein L17 [Salinibacter sp.]
MRHRKKGKKIGRTSPHRKRTLQALSNALIENKQITTTVAKAKALRPFVEPLITRAKKDTEHNRRQVFRHLQNKETISELFTEVADRVGDRPGGYTRIIKLGKRSGDGAELALVELVDYNDVPPSGSRGGSSGGTRRGSGKGRRDSSGPATDASKADSSSTDEPEPEEPEADAEKTDDDAQAEAEDSDTDDASEEASDTEGEDGAAKDE